MFRERHRPGNFYRVTAFPTTCSKRSSSTRRPVSFVHGLLHAAGGQLPTMSIETHSTSYVHTPMGTALRHHFIFLHSRQYRAALPQQQSRSVAACRQRGRGRKTVVIVLPRGRGHVRRGRKIDDCLRTLGRRYCKKLSEPKEARYRTAALVTKACSDETGMQAICGDARAEQPASQLTRK
jgi:hypothetical protein